MNKGDKLIWIWLSSKKGTELRSKTDIRNSPPSLQKLWAWVFEKDAAGSYVRGARALAALRKRSKAYRLAGTPALRCAVCAQADLVDAVSSESNLQVTNCPTRL